MTVSLLLKNLIFTLIVPGTVIIFLPYAILGPTEHVSPLEWRVLQYLGMSLLLLGLMIYLRCLIDFMLIGKGTPAPIDPPKQLVVKGLYRFVRNPMYLGVISTLLGIATFFASIPLLVYTAIVWVGFHLFILLYEEPTLRRKFGKSYERYCGSIHRWLPGKAYDKSAQPPPAGRTT